MYNTMKKLISRRYYADAETAQEKIDVFFAVGRLAADQYAELAALIIEVYGSVS